MLFFSQQGEDLYLLKHFINKKVPDGRFVEVGALDGITYSNTGFIESEFGFSGVLIEPSKHFEQLSYTRPGCLHINKAISDENKMVTFREHYAMSGILDKLPEGHKQNFQHGGVQTYDIEAVTLRSVLSDTKLEYVDFMSIDVEGGELEVLKSMNWDIPTYVICIELDGHNKQKDQSCREILLANGFTLHGRLTDNEFWANPNYFRKTELFDETKPYVDWSSFSHVGQIGNFVRLEPGVVAQVNACILGN